MLNRLRELASRRHDFAFETTLSGRTWVQWLRGLQQEHDYVVLLLYLWLPTSSQAVERVRRRVLAGGHNIPEATIRRRFSRSLRNFFELYEPLADQWVFFDNSEPGEPIPVAFHLLGGRVEVQETEAWDQARSLLNDS
jgi:predicted ABC-type ATPase